MRIALVSLAAFVLLGCKQKESQSLAQQARARAADAGTVQPVPATATLIASGQNVPRDLRSDGDYLYWLNEGRRSEGKPGLFRVAKRGGEAQELAAGLGIYAFDLDADSIYWVHPENQSVHKAPKAGGAATTLATEQENLSALVVDATHVYYACAEEIRRVPKEGGNVEVVASQLALPSGLGLDESFVYWYSPMSGKLAKAPKKKGAVKLVHEDELTLHSFFIDQGYVYWSVGSEKKAVLRRLSLAGGKPVDLVGGQDVPAGFASDSSFVYWTTGESILKVSKDGGAAQKLVEGTDRASSVAVDADRVYWADRIGRIQSAPR